MCLHLAPIFPVPGAGVVEGSHRRQLFTVAPPLNLRVNQYLERLRQHISKANRSRVVGQTLHQPHPISTTAVPPPHSWGKPIPLKSEITGLQT